MRSLWNGSSIIPDSSACSTGHLSNASSTSPRTSGRTCAAHRNCFHPALCLPSVDPNVNSAEGSIDRPAWLRRGSAVNYQREINSSVLWPEWSRPTRFSDVALDWRVYNSRNSASICPNPYGDSPRYSYAVPRNLLIRDHSFESVMALQVA